MGDPIPYDPRVRLAAERTLLAWIRTGLAVMGVGFVLNRHGGTADPVLAGLGLILLLAGSVAIGMSAWQYHRYYQVLGPGKPFQRDMAAWSIWFAVVIALIGGAVTIALGVHASPPGSTPILAAPPARR